MGKDIGYFVINNSSVYLTFHDIPFDLDHQRLYMSIHWK